MTYQRAIAFAAVGALLTAETGAQTANPLALTVDTAHTSIGFAVKHLGLATVRGRFSRYRVSVDFDSANVASSRVTAVIDAASIDTDNERRDTDLKSENYLDVAKFPEIQFVSTKVEAVAPTRWRIGGNLTIKGVTKPTTLEVAFHGMVTAPSSGAKIAAFGAAATINRKDYGVTFNRVVEGLQVVADEVMLTIDVEARWRPPAK